MPEIFIAEQPEPEGDAAYVAEQQAAEMAAIADWAEWLLTQSATVQALAAEWSEKRPSRFNLSERRDKLGRTVYACQSEHGYHESLQSYEHAVFLLVDSHRVRVEDKPETHARFRTMGESDRAARLHCQSIGRDIAKKHGRLPVAEHDALVEAEIAKREADHERARREDAERVANASGPAVGR